ncbi:LysR family transcriptional regulator [Rhizobium rhizogenes]|jgi:DNA-binding transcriptional LysR family regulator|uniref:LysR family transcriptional regulator n=1 Tax=Rhizobium rhizogenes TaxID=359 RepID=UPI001572126F|nr:LysR family transcriptional regulator [Rhizobium rhizogenes]NTH21833.1 LysR family transcriptional regulator [Rhizobium rhizogenes]NTH34976.1 LysR family transcriptional regulator [Rhizobium rhizogenes]
MRHLDLRSAQIFLTVIEEGSIAKAASRENLVSSAISKRLQELELSVGVTLLERSQQGVRLTPAGEAMARHARLVVQAFKQMRAEMADYAKGIRGHVRIRVSASSLAAGLSEQVLSFSAKHSDVKLDLEELETPAIVRGIVEGTADIGIGPNIFPSDHLEIVPYSSYDLALAVPASHPLAGRERLRYEETLAYDHVEQPQSSALAQLLEYASKQSSLIKRTRIRVRGFDGVCHMIGLGMGIGVVPLFLSRTYELQYDLKFVPLEDSWAHPMICIMYRSRGELPFAARAFVEHLESSR